MKKNLLSIIILALLIVNVVLTSIMMFSVLGTSKKTSALVGDIAAALNLELSANADGEKTQENVSIDNTDVYVISEALQIPLAASADGKDHYFVVTVSLSMNKKDADYKTYGTAEEMAAKESLIKSEIGAVVSEYTIDNCKTSQDQIRQEILERLQKMYDSKFIFNVTFSDTYYA